MPCLFAILAYFAPRVLMVFILVLTDWFRRAFETWYWPLLGFVFMPYTTLAYLAAQLYGGLEGWWVALLIVGVVLDLGQGGARRKRRRKR